MLIGRPKACSQLPDICAGEFVVSRGEAAKLLELVEESLDEVSRLIAVPVDLAGRVPVVAGWDDGLSAPRLDDFDQSITVVALVGDDWLSGYGVDQGHPLRDVSHLSAGQDRADGVTQRIRAGLDLGGQPAPRAADRLIATVFLGAPAACWWARTMVASMNNSSRSASPWNASATRCHIPYISQRAKRTRTKCQLPSSFGKSRQGQSVRAIYSTASTNRWLSAAHPPLSVGFPGSKSTIRDHWLSLNICRSVCNPQNSRCKHKLNRPGFCGGSNS